MTTAYTSLLGLALPVQGELSGQWGDVVNNSITSLLDSAVAGTTNVSTDADVTLTTTTGAANTAREAILLFSGARTALRTVTAPAQSKVYTVINATTGGFSVKLVGAGPTTGVTIVAGESAVCAWNGSDFIKISNTAGAGVFSSITNTGLTSGRVVYSTTGGLETDSANLTFNGTTLTANTLNLTNALGTTYGGTGLTSFTANGVVYASSTSALATGSVLNFDGTYLNANGLRISGSDSGNTIYKASGDFGITANTGALTYQTTANQPQVFYVNNSEQMRLTSTGLGIGTSSPSAKLDVSGNAVLSGVSGYKYLYFNGSTESSSLRFAKIGKNYDSTFELGIWASTHTAGNSASTVFYRDLTTESMRLDSSGNLGLGVTPSAWVAYKAFQMQAGSLLSYSTNDWRMVQNTVRTGANFTYLSNGYASMYLQDGGSGGHVWYNAPSGTAGNAITFTQAMTLDASGNLGLGATTTAGGRLVISQSNATQPAIYLPTDESTIQGPNANTKILMGGNLSLNGNGLVGINAVGGSAYITLATANTERARIDSSGMLGIGCTPSPWNANYKGINYGNGSAYGTLVGSSNGAGYADAYGQIGIANNTYYNGTNSIAVGTGASSNYLQSSGYHFWFTAPSVSAGSVQSFTQAMTLDNNGSLLVGTTTNASYGGHVFSISGANRNVAAFLQSNASTPYGPAIAFTAASPNNASQYFLDASDTTTVRFKVYSNGGIANYAANNVILSDRREKTNFAPATSYLDKICAIPVQTFNYIDQNLETDGGLTLGVVAQDVQAIAPELVTESNWGTTEEPKMRLSIYQTDLQYALMKALQELKAEFDAYKASHP